MDERNGSIAQRNSSSIERKLEPSVKDSWLNAYIQGNMISPQKFWAIEIFVACAVLEDFPASWHDFEMSRLSDTQIQRLGDLMSHAHISKGIPYTTLGHAKDYATEKGEPPMEVTQQRLKKQWTDAKFVVIDNICKIVRKLAPEIGASFLLSSETIDTFDKLPGSKEKFAKVLEVLSKLREALKSPEAKIFFESYRQHLTDKKAYFEQFTTHDPLRKIVCEYLFKKGVDMSDPFINSVLQAFSYAEPDKK